MKKISIIVFLGFMLFLSGCNKAVKDINVVCTKSVNGASGETITVTDTSKYNKDKYLTYNEVVTVEKGFSSDEVYKEKKSGYDLSADLMKNNKNYSYTADDTNKVITVKLVMDSFDLTKYSDEEKEGISAKSRITSYENSGYTCEISGTTRKKLGLD